jgi:hypothetical protein
VIDDVAGSFAFPRWPILVKTPTATVPPTPAPAQPSSGVSK